MVPCAGAARWQAAAFQLGGVMTVFGLLVMLMTAYKTFGAAGLLGQVHSTSQQRACLGSCCSVVQAI